MYIPNIVTTQECSEHYKPFYNNNINNNNNNNNNNVIIAHAALQCIKGNKIICIEYIINYIKIFLQFTKKRKKGKYINIYCNATNSGWGYWCIQQSRFCYRSWLLFLVSSVRIWLESHCQAQLSEWINLKLQHPPGGTGPYLVLGGSGEFDVCLGRVGNLNWKCQLWLPCRMTTWVNRCNPSCIVRWTTSLSVKT